MTYTCPKCGHQNTGFTPSDTDKGCCFKCGYVELTGIEHLPSSLIGFGFRTCEDCGHKAIPPYETHCPMCKELLPLTSPHQTNSLIMGNVTGCWMVICIIAFLYFAWHYGGVGGVAVVSAWVLGYLAITKIFKKR